MEINLCLGSIIIIISIILIGYNRLVRLNNRVKQEKSGIDVVLNQRFDLIPNIVECVKGYSKHESETLEDVIIARNTYKDSKEIDLKAAEKVNTKFNHILALAESYPELKADTQYLNLQNQLNVIENKLQERRTSYNRAVTLYNTTIESVPTNIVAKMFNFEKEELFKLEDEKRENINIKI